jgi:hypothetical protein
MATYSNPTVKDLFAPTEERVAVKAGKKTDDGYAYPTLDDMGMPTAKPKRDVSFGGSNFKIGPFDTGLKMSPVVDKTLSGIGQSFYQTGRTAKQLTNNYSRKEADDAAELDAPLLDTLSGSLGSIGGTVAQSAFMPVRTLSGAAGAGIKALGAKRLGTAAAASLPLDALLSGAVMSQMRPMKTGESRLKEAGLGAAGGLGGYALMRPFTALAAKGVNALRDKWDDVAAQTLNRKAANRGVDLTIGDVTKSPAWQSFENMSRDVPFSGRKDIMERQAGQVQDMLYSLREDMRPNLEVVDDVGNLIKYATPEQMTVGELQRNFAKLTKEKDDLFAEVGKIAAANPKVTKVDFDETAKQVQQLLKHHPDIFASFKGTDQRLMSVMKGLDNSLENQGRSKLTGRFAPKATYDEAQWMRQELGSILAAAEKQAQSGTINSSAVGKLKQVYKAVNKDLDNWGAKPVNEPVHGAYKAAQSFYNDNIVPFKRDPTLKKVVNEFAPFDEDLALNTFFKEGRPNLAENIMKFQTPEGQQASQFVIIDDLVNKAVNTSKDTGLDISAYLNKARKLADPSGKVYSPRVQQEMGDVEDILQAAHRSQNYLDSSGNTGRYLAMRGVQTLPYLVAGGAAYGAGSGDIGTTATGLAGLLALTRGLNAMGANPVGKRLLMSSTQLPGGLQNIADLVTTRAGGPALKQGLEGGHIERMLEPGPDPEMQ